MSANVNNLRYESKFPSRIWQTVSLQNIGTADYSMFARLRFNFKRASGASEIFFSFALHLRPHAAKFQARRA